MMLMGPEVPLKPIPLKPSSRPSVEAWRGVFFERLEKVCCVRLCCLWPFLERFQNGWEAVPLEDLDEELELRPARTRARRRSSRWRDENESQFAVYGQKAPAKYEHLCSGGDRSIGRHRDDNDRKLDLNLIVEVFVYEADDDPPAGITRRQLDNNRSQLKLLRKVAGQNWFFLDERDVDHILLNSRIKQAQDKQQLNATRPNSRPYRWNI